MTILDLEIEDRDGLAHVAVRGELDLSTVPKLDEALKRVESDAPAVIALDLKRLSFIDSTGLRLVVRAAERARESGRRLVLVRGPETVQRVFAITRVDEHLEIVDDLTAVNG